LIKARPPDSKTELPSLKPSRLLRRRSPACPAGGLGATRSEKEKKKTLRVIKREREKGEIN